MTTEKSKEAQVQEAVKPEPVKPEPPRRSVLKQCLVNMKDSKQTYLRALLYGVSGSGKTYTARTLPHERTHLLLAEPKRLPLDGYDIDGTEINSWNATSAVFNEISMALKSGGLKINGRKKDILFIDSLTYINGLCKEHIVTRDRPALLVKNKKDLGCVYDEQLTVQDWGLLIARMNNLVSAFCHLPIHLIFTCHEKWTTEEATGLTKKTPLLNGALSLTISHHFDIVFHQKMSDIDGQIATEFETHGTPTMIAKGQDKLDATEPADWTAILQKLFGKRGK